MADHRIIAQQQEKALGRITAALETLSKGQDEPFGPMPMRGRDALVLQKDQMVWIADTLERLAAVPTVEALEGELEAIETDDAKRLKKEQAVKPAEDADRDAEDSSAQDIDKATRSTGKKAK